jgi:hypothetical protein
MIRNIFLVTVIVLSVSVSASAQKINGDLEGTVLDEAGKPVAYATITVSGPNLPGIRVGLSGSNGYFLVPNLPVGRYQVSITHVSFQEKKFEGIPISLGNLTTISEISLSTKLHEAPEIIVAAERPMVDISTTTVGSNLKTEDFEVLPLERDYREISTLLPQANTSYYGDDINYGGATGLENKHYVDGMDITDPYRGRTGMRLPYNFVREVQIKVGSYEAEYNSSLGGILNVITNKGSNEFFGHAHGFFTSNNLSSKPLVGAYEPDMGDYSQYDIGFGLGGAIVRDKLWFYVAYNPTIENDEVLLGELGYYEDSNLSHIFAGKLNWNPSEKINAGFTIIGDPSYRDAVGVTYGNFGIPDGFENPDPWLAELRTGGIASSLFADYFHSDRFFVESNISYIVQQESYQPRAESTESPDLFLDQTAGGLWSGGYFTPVDNMHYRGHILLQATGIVGSHTLKAGARYEQIRSDIDQAVSIIDKYAEDEYGWFYFSANGTVKNRIPSLFVQDSWRVFDQLRLNLGFRWDGQYLVGSDGNTAQKITDQYQPRAGFIFLPGSGGSNKVFGSFARFYQNLSTSLSMFKHIENSAYIVGSYPNDPREDRTAYWEMVLLGEIQPEVEDLRGQYYDEFTLGYEMQFGKFFKAGFTGMYRTLGEAIEDSYIEEADDFLIGNPGRGDLSDYPRARREYRALIITFERNGGDHFNFVSSYVLSKNDGNYTGLFNSDYGYDIPNTNGSFDLLEMMEGGDGLLPNDRTHVLKFAGSYRWDFGFILGSTFSWSSGTPKSIFYPSSWGPTYNFVVPRGTDGRTPSTWRINLRAAYDLPFGSDNSYRSRLLFDVFNIGSNGETSYDQLAYEDHEMTEPNPNFGKATRYEPPLSMRFGLELVF